jgi:hypothetical protein
MELSEFVRSSAEGVHRMLGIAMEDLTDEIVHWRPGGTTNSIAQLLAHTVSGQDLLFNDRIKGGKTLHDSGWAEKTGIPLDRTRIWEAGTWQLDIEAFDTYRREVEASAMACLVSLKPADFDREVAWEVFGAGAAGAPFVTYKKAAFMDPEDTPPAFSLELVAKDMELITGFAERLGVPAEQAQTNLQLARLIPCSETQSATCSHGTESNRKKPMRASEPRHHVGRVVSLHRTVRALGERVVPRPPTRCSGVGPAPHAVPPGLARRSGSIDRCGRFGDGRRGGTPRRHQRAHRAGACRARGFAASLPGGRRRTRCGHPWWG